MTQEPTLKYNKYVARIKKALRENDVYEPIYDIAIERLAKVLCVADLAYNEIEKEQSVELVETTREGNTKTSLTPSAVLFHNSQADIIRYLRELEMTAKTSTSSENDPLDEVIDEVNSVEE